MRVSTPEVAPPREVDPKAGQTLFTVAPGHFIYDERVLRTICAAHGFTRNVYGADRDFYERTEKADPLLAEKVAERLGSEVEVILLPPWRRVRFLARVTRHWYARQIGLQAQQLRPDVVHIHESGVLGLLVAWWVRRFVPGCRIIFDYHDWIPYELAHVVRQSRPLYAASMILTMPVLRRLARAVDTAVCISPGHAQWTRSELGIADTVIIQNVRPPTPPPVPPSGELKCELLFVGNVMRIRRLELMVDVLVRLRASGVDAVFKVLGEVMEPDYAEEVRAQARRHGVEEQVVFLGSFMGDRDLSAHVRRGSLGVVLALDDVVDSGINTIASANKFFSYLALGVPVLVEAPYANMVALATEHDVGVAFDSPDGAAAAAAVAWADPKGWDRMRENALGFVGEMNSDSYAPVLKRLYGRTG
jgi:glycosyltransferase involved in cell wall biosynthesis